MYRLKPVPVFSIVCMFLLSPVLISGTADKTAAPFTTYSNLKPTATSSLKSAAELLIAQSHAMYDSIGLKGFGLTKKAFEYAWRGYHHMKQRGLLDNADIISICDFSQSSRRKRLYIIDLEKMKVIINTYVAHGRNSGGEYARSFSNRAESHKSSLGFYVTRDTYWGGHGLALQIDGIEKGINDKANYRKIVVHGSDYVGAKFVRNNKFNGRSFGCPAVPAKYTHTVINTIKNGSCLFIYHPTKNYLTKSTILNG